MSDYDWLEITAPDDYSQLVGKLDDEFQPGIIAEQLQDSITDTVGGVLIERGYIDKDYRSTFYNFYAKMGRTYREDCVRLHFFDKDVEFDRTQTDIICPGGRPEELGYHYFGYVVLRPTLFATLGRSVLVPKIRVGARGMAIQAQHRVHLLGHRLSFWGFPSMSQHRDIAVCAHVSCWAILRHYSERFPQHRELLIHDITKLATPFEPGGLTPSLGLNVSSSERIFQAAGCFPLIVTKKKNEKDDRFYAQLLAYLESGFPLFVALKVRGYGHAIVIAGYDWRTTAVKPPCADSHVWSQIDTLLAVDDNRLPYSCVNLMSPESSQTTSDGPLYGAQDFEAFIVPLPEKIFYPAAAMESGSQFLYSKLKGRFILPEEDRLLRRYFITTISAFRRYARKNQSSMGSELVNLLMRLDTAQFIWVVEYASDEQWDRGHIAARAIIDATASLLDEVPVWLAHDEREAIVFDRSSAKRRGTVVELNRPAGVRLGRMEQNLRPVRP